MPRAFTVKGVARLATVLSTPIALRATDLIIDTFLTVQEQLARGHGNVAIPEPSRYRPSSEQRAKTAKLKTKLANALNKLLDIIVDVEGNRTGREVARSMGSGRCATSRKDCAPWGSRTPRSMPFPNRAAVTAADSQAAGPHWSSPGSLGKGPRSTCDRPPA